MAQTHPNGVARVRCVHDVAATVERLMALIEARGLRVFARIDFGADARAAGLALRPEQLVVFGNPKSGTPLLAAAPTVGLDLPLKALVFEDADGATWLAYNEPRYVIARHDLASTLEANIAGTVALMEQAASGR